MKKYIKIRQEQNQIIESERDMEYLLSIFPDDDDLYGYIEKNTDIPWSELITEENIIAAVKADVVYFAKNNLNNIIITNTLLNYSTTLINYLREEIYNVIDDDDDFYEVIESSRSPYSGTFIIEEEDK